MVVFRPVHPKMTPGFIKKDSATKVMWLGLKVGREIRKDSVKICNFKFSRLGMTCQPIQFTLQYYYDRFFFHLLKRSSSFFSCWYVCLEAPSYRTSIKTSRKKTWTQSPHWALFSSVLFFQLRGRWTFWSGPKDWPRTDNRSASAAGQRVSPDGGGCWPARQPQRPRCRLGGRWPTPTAVHQCLLHHCHTRKHPRRTTVSSHLCTLAFSPYLLAQLSDWKSVELKKNIKVLQIAPNFIVVLIQTIKVYLNLCTASYRG